MPLVAFGPNNSRFIHLGAGNAVVWHGLSPELVKLLNPEDGSNDTWRPQHLVALTLFPNHGFFVRGSEGKTYHHDVPNAIVTYIQQHGINWNDILRIEIDASKPLRFAIMTATGIRGQYLPWGSNINVKQTFKSVALGHNGVYIVVNKDGRRWWHADHRFTQLAGFLDNHQVTRNSFLSPYAGHWLVVWASSADSTTTNNRYQWPNVWKI